MVDSGSLFHFILDHLFLATCCSSIVGKKVGGLFAAQNHACHCSCIADISNQPMGADSFDD